jgi:hypothetical protein
MGMERFNLGSKCDAVIRSIEEKRFLSGPITGEDELPSTSVPDAQGEHTVKAMDGVFPGMLVKPQNDFGVASGPEVVALLQELFSKLTEVVDLSIENHRRRPVFVPHGLIGLRRQIDDP